MVVGLAGPLQSQGEEAAEGGGTRNGRWAGCRAMLCVSPSESWRAGAWGARHQAQERDVWAGGVVEVRERGGSGC